MYILDAKMTFITSQKIGIFRVRNSFCSKDEKNYTLILENFRKRARGNGGETGRGESGGTDERGSEGGGVEKN